MSKIKLVLSYIFYIAAIFGIYSKQGLYLMNGNPSRTIAGIAVFILLTAVIITLTLYYIRMNRAVSLKNIGIETEKSEIDSLADYAKYFESMVRSSGHRDISEIADKCRSASNRMIEKQKQLKKLLAETFSETDLTYTSYMDSLEEITGIFNNNLKGIRKRMDVFGSADDDSGVTSIYISESRALEDRNEKMLDTMDSLLLEIVRIEDVNDDSLAKLNGLIEQTKLYKCTEEE
ncbi:MAG: hypothetical protein ACI4KF_08600 [Huintestinicola sp.]